MNTVYTVRITDETFAREIDQYDGRAMVDFGADWCAPCRIVAPVVEQLAADYDGRVKVGAVDVDANSETAVRFGIRNLPTILFFNAGRQVDALVGAVPRHVFEQKLEQLLAQQDGAE
jgi:thioredoxin 1